MLADAVVVVHFAFVLFIVLGLALIWVGAARAWAWIRDLRFRIVHFAAIVFVAGEALAGIACPLTVWEDALRAGGAGESFIGRWTRRLLYYDFPEWMFTAAYVVFALIVLATFVAVPPRRAAGRRRD
ncbi:MAG TPA: DUF2784 domain-containing protein [Burkholderiales bacterium]|nr:DUF2784 domain-containing protein [Burkholderiales bacterium]